MFNALQLKNWCKKTGVGLLLLLSFNSFAFAQQGTNEDPNPTPDSLNLHSYLVVKDQHVAPITSYIVRFINFLALTIGSFAFLIIVISGFIMLVSGGAEAQISKAKDAIKFAIIGLVVAFSAYFITAFVQSIFFEYGG